LQILEDTGKILVLPVLCTSIVVPVSRPEEDYHHFFMSCKYLDIFWNKINEMLKKVQFENNIKLQHLVFEYKIFDKDLSILITLPAEIIFPFFILIVVFTDFSSDNCTYHSLGIAFFSRLNSLRKYLDKFGKKLANF
jgi:hypothetical protein